MNMTVDKLSYLTGTRQNMRASKVEKQEQKETETEIGKMQQSMVSASLDQVNIGQDGTAVTETSRQQGTEQSAAPRMDSVEISAEGRAACVQHQGQTTDTAVAEQFEAEDLSEYTDAELKQLYYKGEITRQEYIDETGDTLK